MVALAVGERLAAGGMAEVFVGRAPDGEEFAVKRLHTRFSGEGEYRKMFAAEGRLAVLLRHPNLVRTFEAGFDGGGPFLRMELLRGADLRGILTRGKRRPEVPTVAANPAIPAPRWATVPLDAALTIVADAADALHYAHELIDQGEPLELVHRDVSPHNIFVTIEGVVKVLDFGIARTAHRGWETQEGTLKGKVPYMAPEQLKATTLDRRTDIYALGVVLYELTVGRLPYPVSQNSDVPLMLAIARHDVVAPCEVAQGYPPELEAVVLRALAFRATQRFATGAEFADALRGVAMRLGLTLGPTATRPLVEAERSAFQNAVELPATDLQTVQAPTCRAIVAVEQLGPATLFTLAGAIDEHFAGASLGAALRGPTVLDVSGIRRVTSYGVREWFAFLGALGDAPCTLFGCPDAVLSQIEMVRGFRGPTTVAAAEAPYHCDHCGHDFVALVFPPPRAFATRHCVSCGRDAKLDADDTTYAPLGVDVPTVFEGPVGELARRREEEERALVAKSVNDGRTTLLLRRPPAKPLRWHKLLDGVEGWLLLDLTAWPALDDVEATSLAKALRTLGEVTRLELPRLPLALFQTLRRERLPYPVVAKQVAQIAPCPACGTPRVAVGALSGELSELTTPPALRCVQCALVLVLGDDPRPAAAPPRVAPVPKSPPVRDAEPPVAVTVTAPNAAYLRYVVPLLLLAAALAVGFAAASLLTRTR